MFRKMNWMVLNNFKVEIFYKGIVISIPQIKEQNISFELLISIKKRIHSFPRAHDVYHIPYILVILSG